MSTMDRLLNTFKNKYLLVVIFFILWMLFFDRYDFVFQYQCRAQLKKLELEKKFYADAIVKTRRELKELNTSAAMFEKFVREKYLMKRKHEDIYVIVDEFSER